MSSSHRESSLAQALFRGANTLFSGVNTLFRGAKGDHLNPTRKRGTWASLAYASGYDWLFPLQNEVDEISCHPSGWDFQLIANPGV